MTQTERVIKHLKEHGSITPLEAIKEYESLVLVQEFGI